MLFRPLPTILLQIVCEFMINSKGIIKSTIGPDKLVSKHDWVTCTLW